MKMLIFYSGEENLGNPETVLGEQANLMLTYHNMLKGPDRRFRAILKARKRARKRGIDVTPHEFAGPPQDV